MNTYIQNAKEKNSHVIQLCKGLSFAEQKPLTCLRSCYNTYKFLKRNEKSLFMMGESQTEHIIGKKWSIKVACYLGSKSIMHQSPVIAVYRYLGESRTIKRECL